MSKGRDNLIDHRARQVRRDRETDDTACRRLGYRQFIALECPKTAFCVEARTVLEPVADTRAAPLYCG
ncbi:MAG: hypothetical protein ABSH47_22615 [Bryobacteraceae bacterium]